MTDITELAQSLKAAITEATPGGWYVDDDFDVCTEGCGFIAETHGNNLVHNAQYIALANPANILALVEALESRTVTVKLLDCDLAAVQHMSGGSKHYCNGFVDGTQNAIRAMRDAGVDVREAE